MSQASSGQDFKNLTGYGPLSRVINVNSDYARKNVLTIEEAERRFVQKGPNDDVSIQGDLITEGDATIKGDLVIEGNVTAHEVTTTSDERVKTDLLPVNDALDKVLRLNGYSFTRKDWEKIGVPKDKRFIGVMAQEVQQVIPELVKYDVDTDLLSVNYPSLAAVLVESIKDLHALQEQMQKNTRRSPGPADVPIY